MKVVKSNAEWMVGKRGLMIHYLPPLMEGRDGSRCTDVDEAAESFRMERFLNDFDRTGSDYLLFTLGQNTGMYNAPNPVIEKYAGPGHCPRRDLAGELALAMKERGKRFLAYLPTEMHCNGLMQKPFGWIKIEGVQAAGKERQELFQERWCEAIRYWSMRYGTLLDGWWLDGCHWLKIDHKHWRAALRAGNPESAIAFSYAEFIFEQTVPRLTDDDYFSGEVYMLRDGLPRLGGKEGFRPAGSRVPGTVGTLWHALVPLDVHWYRGDSPDWCKLDGRRYIDPATLKTGEMDPPMYSDDELVTLHEAFPGQGGALTLNAGIFLDGSLGSETVAQLERVTRLADHAYR